jgi:hypothetical protein
MAIYQGRSPECKLNAIYLVTKEVSNNPRSPQNPMARLAVNGLVMKVLVTTSRWFTMVSNMVICS